MAERPEDDWCTLLAGQDAPDAPEALKREVQLLRQALATRNEEIDRLDIPAEAVESGLAAMLNQARIQGLLEAQPAASVSVRHGQNPGWLGKLAKFFGVDEGQGFMPAMAIAATLVLGVGVALVMMPEQRQPYELERGASKPGTEAGMPREVADPAGAARRLAEMLRALGLTVTMGEDLGLWFVEADVRAADPAALHTLLEREGFAPPPDGRLRVVFAPRR